MQGCLAGLISRLQAFFERRLADTLLGSSLWTRRYERARLTGSSPSQAVLLVIGMDWGCARCSGSSWLSGVTAPLLARVRDRAQAARTCQCRVRGLRRPSGPQGRVQEVRTQRCVVACARLSLAPWIAKRKTKYSKLGAELG